MKFQEWLDIIDYINHRMRIYHWWLWPNVTNDKILKWYKFFKQKEDNP